MADEHEARERGPAARGNGGPVTPGAAPSVDGIEGGEGNGADNSGGGLRAGGGVPALRDAPGELDGPDSAVDRGPAVGEQRPPARSSRAHGLWVGLTLSAVVLLFLLIFIVQNNVPTEIRFLGLAGTLPVGVALLFAAALGILLVAIPGYLRILQLRRAVRKRG